LKRHARTVVLAIGASVLAMIAAPVIDGDTVYFDSWDGQPYAVG
jgi:hypothetical protein